MTQRAVSNGRINYLSASQITKFDSSQEGGCARRWYFDKVLQIPEPATKSQALGTQVHAEIENYLKTGVKALGKTALAGFDFLPAPGSVLVEHSLEGFSIARVPVKGFIDALNLSGKVISESGLISFGANPEIIDWKTASDIKSKGPGSQLIDTIQMALYGKYALDNFEHNGAVHLSHVYFSTRGAAQAVKKSALFSVDKIEERYQDISQVVESMKVAAQAQGVEELEPNLNACHAFHRECVYARHCPRNISIFDLGIEKGVENMGLFDKVSKAPAAPLNEEKTTPKPLTNGAAPVSVKEVLATPEPKKDDFETALADLKAEEQRALNAFGVDTSITFQSIVPPDAKPSEGSGTFDPEPAEKVKSPRKKKEVTQEIIPAKSNPDPLGHLAQSERRSVVSEVSNPCEENPVYVAPKVETVDLTKVDLTKSTEIEDEQNNINEWIKAQEVSVPLELYVNVSIRGLQTKDLQTEINRALRRIESDYGVKDIRLGKDALAYGGWKGVLAAEIKSQNLQGRYSINGNGDFISVVIEALESQDAITVKGL